jgi:PKD repeat protein
MSGEDAAPTGNLTGDVTFTMGAGNGCGTFDYGYLPGGPPGGGGGNTPPTAAASATPSTVRVGQSVTLSAAGSTDAESPNNLTYSWDLDNGGTTKDAVGKTVTTSYAAAGQHHPKVTVSDPQGSTASASTTVTVTAAGAAPGTGPVARIKIHPKRPGTDRKVRFSARRSTGAGPLTFAWNFHNGGKRVDARTMKVKVPVRRPGRHKVSLVVTDSTGATAKTSLAYRVRHHHTHRMAAPRAAGSEPSRDLFAELFGLS